MFFSHKYLERKYLNGFPTKNICNPKNNEFVVDSDLLGGLLIIVTSLILFSCLVQFISYLLDMRKLIKTRKNLDLFAVSSPFDIKKKKKKWFLSVTDYIHIPDPHSILPELQKELNRFHIFYCFKL